jgi:hypothetical protein
MPQCVRASYLSYDSCASAVLRKIDTPRGADVDRKMWHVTKKKTCLHSSSARPGRRQVCKLQGEVPTHWPTSQRWQSRDTAQTRLRPRDQPKLSLASPPQLRCPVLNDYRVQALVCHCLSSVLLSASAGAAASAVELSPDLITRTIVSHSDLRLAFDYHLLTFFQLLKNLH